MDATPCPSRIDRRAFLRLAAGAVVTALPLAAAPADPPLARSSAQRLNILWIIAEDMSCHFGCYGEKAVNTPVVDGLAREGIRFENAIVTGTICAPMRSGLITGMHQTTIGAHHMRSSRGRDRIEVPKPVELLPDILRRAGYYVCNGDYSRYQRLHGGKTFAFGKEDYNFVYRQPLYDGLEWSGRAAGQPFFAQVQLTGGKFGRRLLEPEHMVKPESVTPPPYYPDTDDFREEWAKYLSAVNLVDLEVGEIIERLQKEGLLENTAVFFFTDHGLYQIRGKGTLYEHGVRVPLILRLPGKRRAGEAYADVVAQIDISATSLELAGIPIPGWMEGRSFLSGPPRQYVVSARDRWDENVDHMRSVRTRDCKYIRNYYPRRPLLAPLVSRERHGWMQKMRALHERGELSSQQDQVFATERAPEELYDLKQDPLEFHNLAGEAAWQAKLKEMRRILDDWIAKTGDKGQRPESDEAYQANLDDFVPWVAKTWSEALARQVEQNAALMRRWASEDR
ncbi:MAG: sulfatase [bacterium]|nr:sulfatase [bacterium]